MNIVESLVPLMMAYISVNFSITLLIKTSLKDGTITRLVLMVIYIKNTNGVKYLTYYCFNYLSIIYKTKKKKMFCHH